MPDTYLGFFTMKKVSIFINFVVIAVICGMMFVSCGSCGGSNAEVKKDEAECKKEVVEKSECTKSESDDETVEESIEDESSEE